MKLNSKIKIFLVSGAFLLFAGIMFFYGYGILASGNQAIGDTVKQRRTELDVLQREQKNFEQGKKDLATLSSATYPPDDLFSSDTKVVKEIQQLEAASNLYGVELTITISGTTKTAIKADGATGEVYKIPYTMTVTGTFENTLSFMQAIEHLPYVTRIDSLQIAVGEKNKSVSTFLSEFYIKK
jgi:Tfp pilus assembly protein PilO